MNLELQIYHHNESTNLQSELDIDYKISDCTLKPITFYNIDTLNIYVDSDDEKTKYGCITVGGNDYISPLQYLELKMIIDKHLKGL